MAQIDLKLSDPTDEQDVVSPKEGYLACLADVRDGFIKFMNHARELASFAWLGTDGKVPLSQLPTGTTANKLVQLDADAKLPAVDGSALTNLPTSSFESPIAVKGDLIVGDANGDAAKFAVGTDGQIPYADSTQPLGMRWDAPPKGGSGAGGRAWQTQRIPFYGADGGDIYSVSGSPYTKSGTWTWGQNTQYPYGGYSVNSGNKASTDWIAYAFVPIVSGPHFVSIESYMSADQGIVHVYLDSTDKGQIDCYSASDVTWRQMGAISLGNLTAGTTYILKFRPETKNASASAYAARIYSANISYPIGSDAGVGGDMLLVGRVVADGTSPTLSVANIPNDGFGLVVRFQGRSSADGDNVTGSLIQFNDDNGSNYTYAYSGTSSGSATGNTVFPFALPGAGSAAGWTSGFAMNVFNYASTAFHKLCNVQLSNYNYHTAQCFADACIWGNTNPITKVSVSDGSGNLVAGSTLEVYKIGDFAVRPIAPTSVDMCAFFPTATVGTWTALMPDYLAMTGLVFGGGMSNSSDAQNDSISWDVPLQAGTWKLRMVHFKSDWGAIKSIYLDDVLVGTIDGYESPNSGNSFDVLTGIVVATSGLHTLKVKAATRNPSNVRHWQMVIQGLNLTRTGA